MIIMKFGGTSVGTPQSIANVLQLVQQQRAEDPVVVVSAFSGVTNALVELGNSAPRGAADLGPITLRHRQMLADLRLPGDLLDPLLGELADLTRGMQLVKEASPRAMDLLLSYGERCSARVVAAYFTAQGMPAVAVDAFAAGLRSDSNFGRARPVPDDGRIARAIDEARQTGLPVITGFLAADKHGNITTLGRNGSDYSAALFGNALDVREIQIWTDVDGVMTADPRLVEGTRPIPTMSFGEASELAYYGGKVLHPATILPAMQKNIPVRVLNTHRPDSPGTVILPRYSEPGVPVRAVVHKPGIHLITLVSPPMLQQHGFLARVFAAAAEHEVDVDLVATSEVSITMTADRADHLQGFRDALSGLGEVSVESGHAMVCVVGQGIAAEPGVAAQVLGTLAEHRVRVRVISQGAIKVNIALVIDQADLARAVNALHRRFFG
ncbi:MAG: aspartate kinase [Planctomycetes bacterium]|nr:aspartate kinase [Planctomycetota bacterium]